MMKNITTTGVIVSVLFLVGAILSFKSDLLVLGFALCTAGTISFYVGVWRYQ